jgi:hypothetical protein
MDETIPTNLSDHEPITKQVETPKFAESEKRSFFGDSHFKKENKRSKTIFEQNSTQFSDNQEYDSGSNSIDYFEF